MNQLTDAQRIERLRKEVVASNKGAQCNALVSRDLAVKLNTANKTIALVLEVCDEVIFRSGLPTPIYITRIKDILTGTSPAPDSTTPDERLPV